MYRLSLVESAPYIVPDIPCAHAVRGGENNPRPRHQAAGFAPPTVRVKLVVTVAAPRLSHLVASSVPDSARQSLLCSAVVRNSVTSYSTPPETWSGSSITTSGSPTLAPICLASAKAHLLDWAAVAFQRTTYSSPSLNPSWYRSWPLAGSFQWTTIRFGASLQT